MRRMRMRGREGPIRSLIKLAIMLNESGAESGPLLEHI